MYSNKKIVVVGAGAIGSFYGGMLKRAGADVTLITRGKHLEAIRKNGLFIKSYKFGEFNVKIDASNIIDSEYDIAIISTKSQDTESACLMLKDYLKKDGIVVSFQNGVDNKAVLQNYFSNEQIVLGMLFVGLKIDPPGTVNHTAEGKITIGKIAGSDDKLFLLKEYFEYAGLECEISDKIEEVLWKKLLWNIAYNPLSAILETTCGKMVDDSGIKELMMDMMLEGIKAAKIDGIDIPVKYAEAQLNLSEELKNYKTSMLQDIERGKSPEIDGILLPVIRRFESLGKKAYHCDTVYRLLKFKYGKRFIYTPKLTVDVIVKNSKDEILLIERKNYPFGYALPGGFVDYGEKVEDAAKRELFEETNILIDDLKMLGVYSDPKRDPRGHTVSVVYYTEYDGDFMAGDDAKNAAFFSLENLPENIAFDHKKILEDYKKILFSK